MVAQRVVANLDWPLFLVQRGRPRGDLPALVHQLGLEQGALNQPWVELSVREGGSRNPSTSCTASPTVLPACPLPLLHPAAG